MNKPILIVLEGHDRTGKDTVLNQLRKNGNVYIYEQIPHESNIGLDYRNKEQYEKWIYNHIDNIYNNLVKLSEKNKVLAISRLWLSDNVYSDLFGRNHIVEKYFKQKFLDFFEVKTFIILWDNYEEYLHRLYKINENIEYNEDEFNKIKELYLKYAKESDKILMIENLMSSYVIFSNFANNILKYVLNE